MTVFVQDTDLTLHVGDVREVLARLPDGSVDCVVTSPPYWGLRDYGTGSWEGGDEGCDHRAPPTGGPNPERYTPGGGEMFRAANDKLYQGACGKCGARRVDRQLGLEPTPDEYVANMVAVFREVRRVLADHGTCWVNLGDSYASGTGGNLGATSTFASPKGSRERSEAKLAVNGGGRAPVVAGLKPKDLVGIPWKVAQALQAPYYTGRIRDERDRIWLAAMVEAEGCMFIHRRKAGQSNGQGYERKNDTYGAGLEVSSTDRVIVERCMEIAGAGSVCEQAPSQNHRRKQTLYRWNMRTNECRDIIRELYPHFLAKKHEARLLLGCPSSGDDARKAHESLKAIHQGHKPCIDFGEPEGMWERGWFLRSEIIWSKKPNPMPESVTDRPTKAHEQIFLLSKGPRYFFDQEAVREPNHHDGRHIDVKTTGDGSHENHKNVAGRARWPNPAGRNVRSVWQIATQPYAEAHFATFPEELPRRCILAGCPEWVCATCGKPRERIMEATGGTIGSGGWNEAKDDPHVHEKRGGHKEWNDYRRSTVGWSDCGHGNYRAGVVLDPFGGSGTTALVARNHGRRSILIELNPEYARLAAERLSQLSLLAEGAA